MLVGLPSTEPSWHSGSSYCMHSPAKKGRATAQSTELNGVTIECSRFKGRDQVCMHIDDDAWPRLPFLSQCAIGKQVYDLEYFAGGEADLTDGAPIAVYRADGNHTASPHTLPGKGWKVGEGSAILDDGTPWLGVSCRVLGATADVATVQVETTPETTSGSGHCLLPGDRTWPLRIHRYVPELINIDK